MMVSVLKVNSLNLYIKIMKLPDWPEFRVSDRLRGDGHRAGEQSAG